MSNSTHSSAAADTWQVGDVTLGSRFLLGTAGYPSPQVLRDAIVAAGTQVVTVGLKRTLAAAGDNGFIGVIQRTLPTPAPGCCPTPPAAAAPARRCSWRTWRASCTTRRG